jgi:hypothetical protein
MYVKVTSAMVARDHDERGQGTLEYVGAVVIAAAVVVLVAQAFAGIDVTGAVTTAVNHFLTGA